MEALCLFGELPESKREVAQIVTRKEAASDNVLQFLGRESNKNMPWFKLAASKHCQYFTPVEFSEAIYRSIAGWIGEEEKPPVFDPTCGTGRLLLPWKKAGHEVLGIDLDDQMVAAAKRLIGSDNVRLGDLLDYMPYIKHKAGIIVTNPPFGLSWDIEGKEEFFENYGIESEQKSIESEYATMCAAFEAMQLYYKNSIVVAILPARFAKSEKYKRLIHENSYLSTLADVEIQNLFKKEYNIDVVVHLQVFLRRRYSQRYDFDPRMDLIDVGKNDWQEKLAQVLRFADLSDAAFDSGQSFEEVPQLDRLVEMDVSSDVHLTVKGFEADAATSALLAYHDQVFRAYDPVRGIQNGAISATASRVALLARGTEPAVTMLSRLGYRAFDLNAEQREKFEQAKRRYEFLSTPLTSPKPHDLLAYFLDRPYIAQKTIKSGDEQNAVIWKKGKSYHFRPGWIRQDAEIKREAKQKGEKNFLEIHHRESGFLQIMVEAENKAIVIDERDAEAVKRLIEAFGLPEVADVNDRHADLVTAYRKRIEKLFPFLFEYQAEDISALATKPTGYLGYEMGGGKTVTAAAWAELRGYQRVLVVCQSGLIQNWLSEMKKFGFDAQELKSFAAVAKLRDEIRANKKNPNKKAARTKFYITSYGFLANGDRVYDPWTCIREREGADDHEVKDNTGHSCRECGQSYLKMHPECPKCGERNGWSGYCRACGYRAFTYGQGATKTGYKSYPAAKILRKLFAAILIDEAQEAKSKTSLRGQAVRSIRAKGKLALTGTIMKGYITDIYWTMGWLLGHNTPLFPYAYAGGSKHFLNEFATYDFVDKVFEDTLSKGRAKLIPEVSNLNRFRRLLAPMSIRRLKSDMPALVDLPKKTRFVERLSMDGNHSRLYTSLATDAKESISNEFRKAADQYREVNMGVISRSLWSLTFAATIPTAKDHLPECLPEGTEFNKLRRILELVDEAKAAGDKVLIFSGIRAMQSRIAEYLTGKGHKVKKILASCDTRQRLNEINDFAADPDCTAIVTGLNVLNRGFTITCANRVIITDIDWSPESHKQAEDRVHRPGQKKPVSVYYLFSGSTIDEHIYAVTEMKQKAIDQAMDGIVDSATANMLRESSGNMKMAVAKMILS